MVEAGETIVTEIVLFPLRQKGEEVVKENVQANDDESQDVVLDNPDDEKTILSKMEGKKLIFDRIRSFSFFYGVCQEFRLSLR